MFWTIIIQVILFSLFSFLIVNFVKDFKVNIKKILIFLLPLLTYLIGFSLRVTSDKSLVDLGFFFTEFSTIFVTVLFTICLYLGQVKYWREK